MSTRPSSNCRRTKPVFAHADGQPDIRVEGQETGEQSHDDCAGPSAAMRRWPWFSSCEAVSTSRACSSSAPKRCDIRKSFMPVSVRVTRRPIAVEQLHPVALLQRFHLDCEGRLRQPQTLRRFREAALAGNRAEGLELSVDHAVVSLLIVFIVSVQQLI